MAGHQRAPHTPRRHRLQAVSGRSVASRVRVAARVVVSLAAVAVLVTTGVSYYGYHAVTNSVTQSSALADSNTEPKSAQGDQNILIMGLDSRLDEQGQPLPQDIYDALHAGDNSSGGYNSNVLIFLHIPGDGSKITGISIPRDDYVDLPGCPDGQCKGKIKQAYGLAVDEERHKQQDAGADATSIEQTAREAGRKSEIDTVRTFLGGVPIDHFVEVTLVAFFQIAQVVQPIQVCLNEDTSDSFSGAKFHAGLQDVDASQALAFVRQRRDPNEDLQFTDLDRDRRQQAFIASLASKLKENGTLTDFGRLQQILDVAKKNIAIDSGLDLISFAKNSANLSGSNTTFYTLPIDHFGQDDNGEDVNIVDLPTIHSIVASLLKPASAATVTPTPTPTPQVDLATAARGIVLNVVNSTGTTGLATEVETKLSGLGFLAGEPSTGLADGALTEIKYGAGAQESAQGLSDLIGGPAIAPDTKVPSGTVQLTLGSDFTLPAALNSGSTSSSDLLGTTTTPPPPVAVPANGVGNAAPLPTNLTELAGAGIPCVK